MDAGLDNAHTANDLGLEPVVELSTDSGPERAICVRHARYPSASGVLLPN
jgi:hypothetical protein